MNPQHRIPPPTPQYVSIPQISQMELRPVTNDPSAKTQTVICGSFGSHLGNIQEPEATSDAKRRFYIMFS